MDIRIQNKRYFDIPDNFVKLCDKYALDMSISPQIYTRSDFNKLYSFLPSLNSYLTNHVSNYDMNESMRVSNNLRMLKMCKSICLLIRNIFQDFKIVDDTDIRSRLHERDRRMISHALLKIHECERIFAVQPRSLHDACIDSIVCLVMTRYGLVDPMFTDAILFDKLNGRLPHSIVSEVCAHVQKNVQYNRMCSRYQLMKIMNTLKTDSNTVLCKNVRKRTLALFSTDWRTRHITNL